MGEEVARWKHSADLNPETAYFLSIGFDITKAYVPTSSVQWQSNFAVISYVKCCLTLQL